MNNYPLGVPINRPPVKPAQVWPIVGRPNWYRDKYGNELYREPPPVLPTSAPLKCQNCGKTIAEHTSLLHCAPTGSKP
jgi:hypothetical protein